MEILFESKLQTISSPPSGLRTRFVGVRPTYRRASSWSVFRSMEATCAEPVQATNALLESGKIATPSGCWHSGRVARTRGREASMSETELSWRLLTTSVLPSGETLASPGEAPTGTLPRSTRLSRSRIETLAEAELAT